MKIKGLWKCNGSDAKVDADIFSAVSEEELVKMGIGLFSYFLHDEYVCKFRKMLTIEHNTYLLLTCFRTYEVIYRFNLYLLDGAQTEKMYVHKEGGSGIYGGGGWTKSTIKDMPENFLIIKNHL